MKTQQIFLFGVGLIALGTASVPVRADEKGERILREAYKTLSAAQTMTAKITVTGQREDDKMIVIEKGEVMAAKPNLLMVRLTRQTEKGPGKIVDIYAATGKDYFTYSTSTNSYSRRKLEDKPTDFPGAWEGEIDSFFGGEKNLDKGTADYSGMEKVGDVDCNVVKAKLKPVGQAPERVITYYIGQKDHLIHRTAWVEQTQDGESVVVANTLTDINLKADKKPEDFQYEPPKDAKIIKPKRDII